MSADDKKVFAVFEVYGDGDGYAVFDFLGVAITDEIAQTIVQKFAARHSPKRPAGGDVYHGTRDPLLVGERFNSIGLCGHWGYVIEQVELTGELASEPYRSQDVEIAPVMHQSRMLGLRGHCVECPAKPGELCRRR
jgi:hypothetical protein